MNLPFVFAVRYLFARKFNLINVISLISMIGVAGMTAAIVVILSVFNGFDMVISGMINKFDPDLQITAKKGKTFMLDSTIKNALYAIEGVSQIVETVEETALFQYEKKQVIANIKGVDLNYGQLCQLSDNVVIGDFLLRDTTTNRPYAIVGSDIAANLFVNINYYTPLKIWVPLRSQTVSLNPNDAFNHSNIIPSGIFQVHQDFDSKYVIVPIDFARNVLLFKNNECSAIEIACSNAKTVDKVANMVANIMGNDFVVKNRYQQQEMLYKIMKSEKLTIFVMLSFIVVIASFNIIGALTMLILDKKRDILILRHLGASEKFLQKIFLSTGRLITLIGALAGIVVGTILSLIQQKFGIIEFPSSGSFVIDAYPVDIKIADIIAAFVVVVLIGFIASMYPASKLKTYH